MIGWVLRLNERYVLNKQKKQFYTLSLLKGKGESVDALAIYDLVGPYYGVFLFYACVLFLSPINALVSLSYCADFSTISGGVPFIFLVESVAYFATSVAITAKSALRYYHMVHKLAPICGSVHYRSILVSAILMISIGAICANYILKSAFNTVSCNGGGNIIDFIFYINSPFIFQMPIFWGVSMIISFSIIISKRGA